MLVTATVKGAGVEFAVRMRTLGLDAKFVLNSRNGSEVRVSLPRLGTRVQKYFMPRPLAACSPILRREWNEFGGYDGVSGAAIIVTDIWGRRLRPYRLSSKPLVEIAHLTMPLQKTVITVHARTESPTVLLYAHRFVQELDHRDGKLFLFKRDRIGTVRPEHLTKQFETYQAAVQAAVEKANCLGCTHAHFVEDQSPRTGTT